jgi:hypothetical protein
VGLKLNWTHQLLAYTDDVNLLGDNMDTIKKNTETLIDASKEVGPEINVKKIKYMLLFFYLWVLHPVAHLSNWFLMMPSIATKFQYVNSPFLLFLLTHYMFRPLRAILR